MNARIWVFTASLAVAPLVSTSTAFAVPLISGCADNGDGTQTCNFYETDANGSPSEISSTVFNQFQSTTSWHSGYSAIDDPITGTLSDIIVWVPITPGSIYAESAILYSCDDGAAASNCNTSGLTPLGTASEDTNGDLLGATKPRFNSDNTQVAIDTLNAFSPPESVPEPFSLSLFGAGLAGAFALRRRRRSDKAV